MTERANNPARQGVSSSPKALYFAAAVATFGGLYLASRHDYLLFHCLAEGFSIVVACGVFMLAWNSRRILDNDYFLLLGIAFLFIGSLDLVHTLAYRGMGVFRGYGANLATQLWIAARYLEALTLLAAPLALKVRLRPRLTLLCYAAVTVLLLGAVFGGYFPVCFVEGPGLTPFKVGSEWVICTLLGGAAVVLYRCRAAFERDVLRLLIAAILVTIGSEMSFTLYVDPYGFFNLLGHFLKIVSFYLIYRAVIVTGMSRPYDLLYHRLSESEERYRSLFESMTEAFALHEMITDPQGRPCDYRFIDVNPAFERLTGLAREKVVGASVLQVLPGTKRPWIDTYGKVVLTGEPAHIESYSSELGRWYEAYAYRPAGEQLAVVFSDVTKRKQAEEDLRELNASLEQRVAERTAEVREQAQQLRALASQLSRAEQSERKRLATVLHDHIQQLLAAARMHAAVLRRDQSRERVVGTGQAIEGIIEEAIDACRSLAVDLSPPVLRHGGLSAAFTWLAARMHEQHQLEVQVRSDSRAEPTSEEMRFLLFECVRELLFNTVKHAGVSEADLSHARTADGLVEIVVADRGRGFDPDLLRMRRADQMTFGLFGVQERLAYVGGQTAIETAPGRGTRVRLTAPMGE